MTGRKRRNRLGWSILLPVLLSAAFASGVFAQSAPEAISSPRFDINRFDVSGNTLLPAPEVERLVAPYTGKNKDFADIQRALEAIEQAFRDRGYGVVQVVLPEQDITRGVVQFRVLQPRIGRVSVEGNTHFDAGNIRRSLPSVKEGETPNSREIARSLQLTAEHPVKQTNVLLRSGATEETVDVNVKVADEKPWRAFFTLDDTGTESTGYFRAGVGLQHSNLFNRDHTLTATYITSPGHWGDVSIYGLGYKIPYYHLNSSLELIAGYSDVASGTVPGLFNVSGSGTVAAVRWNYILPKWGEIEQKVALGLDYRAFKNDATDATGALVTPDITVRPASVTYSGLRRMTAAELSFYGGLVRNIPGGNDGEQEHFEASRPGANANYTIIRAGMNYVRQFRNEWQMRVGLNGQVTSDSLISGEQYGLGGPDSVRGYPLRDVTGDNGFSGQAEIYTPDVARGIGMADDYKMRFLGFYDWGTISYNNLPPAGVRRDSIDSFGVGFRFTYKKWLSLRLDLAHTRQETPTRDNHTQRLSGSLALVF